MFTKLNDMVDWRPITKHTSFLVAVTTSKVQQPHDTSTRHPSIQSSESHYCSHLVNSPCVASLHVAVSPSREAQRLADQSMK